MLGEPLFMTFPAVLGFRLKGALREGVTATDLVLTVTEMLRKKGVVGKFVEFFGPGTARMGLADRATVANMAPEYGATMGFFPVDEETLRYYRMTGRSDEQVDLVERYFKEQGMFAGPGQPEPAFSETVELDLGTVEPCLAGPKRPEDRVALGRMKSVFFGALEAPVEKRGFGLSRPELEKAEAGAERAPRAGAVGLADARQVLGEFTHGSVAIAAITSCTNTSNPSVMIGAGILAKKAIERGLSVKPYVKTSLAPGSAVVTEYLKASGLDAYLERLGFYTVGYGCTTCIGNSGPLPQTVSERIRDRNLVVASVLSGNRNFEGRVHPLVKANYLASPPLVVAFAIAGRVDIDLTKEPLGKDRDGRDVYLKDIWPADEEVRRTIDSCVTAKIFRERYARVFSGNPDWDAIRVAAADLYDWSDGSTYIQEPPFFENVPREPAPLRPIEKARVLVYLGDSITTDHISPAGGIDPKSPAGRYLVEKGVGPEDFNSYGARRGNDRVMVRGTFANVRLRNKLAAGREGSWTLYHPDGEFLSIFDAAARYKKEGIALLVIAGRDYGAGSSRDWAAKGTALLGVRAVIAQSFERIHRSNLIGMGVLPLQFKEGESAQTLGLTGDEHYAIEGTGDAPRPKSELTVRAVRGGSGRETRFTVTARLDTPVEADYYRHGGILPYVLRKLMKAEAGA
jgi:aconitate hydratase